MADKELVITHLQIIHTWADFARERDLQFFTKKHLEDIAQWSEDAINLLKEQNPRKGQREHVNKKPDMEKVIKGLNQHCEGSMFDRCGECPYYEFADKPFQCRDELLRDTLALLK